MSTHSRPARVAQMIQQEIARVLTRGIKDPRVGFVTVTGVKVGPDLHQATVYYSVMGDEAVQAETQKGLMAARGYLRREVASAVKMRHTPELFFKFDPSVQTGDRIEQLLRGVKAPPGESES